MLVLNTTSPNFSPVAPKPRPTNTVPSSRASLAGTCPIVCPPPPRCCAGLAINSSYCTGAAREKKGPKLRGATPQCRPWSAMLDRHRHAVQLDLPLAVARRREEFVQQLSERRRVHGVEVVLTVAAAGDEPPRPE